MNGRNQPGHHVRRLPDAKVLYRLIREDAARVGVTEVQLIVLYTLLKKNIFA